MAYDYDLYVIGAGSGGVRCARFSAGYGAKVAIAEGRYLGGTCVNVGCVPKKFMVYAANFADEFELASSYGWTTKSPTFDWSTLIENKDRQITRLNGIYRNLLVNSGVTLHDGLATIIDPHTVEVNGQTYTAERILIATGGWPQVPDIPGKEYITTSNEVFHLAQQPKRVLIVGGGYIAVEFASIFNGCGSQTRLVYRGDRFLRGFDESIREHMETELDKKGITLSFNTEVTRIEKSGDAYLVTLNTGEQSEVDCVFYATGRRPMLDGLGLDNVGISLDKRGFIPVNSNFETNVPSILAIGDVLGKIQLTPVALAEGMAVARQLFKPEQYRAVDYELIPTAVFTLPNIATVGLTEQQALAKGYTVDVYESKFRALKLTLTSEQEQTLMKLVVDHESQKVLGCHMIGSDAGEIIQGLAVALKAGATKDVFDETIGIHPTAAEEFVTMRTVARTVEPT